ncbi:hypothetical protein ACIBPB_10705 [Micromonospora sp. NPDC049836]|uniref:hypothetical protein n=1 Tax=Micromonospora sp. NPDC049836 TaxID=3364274 RepID=UPI0037A0B361
MTASPASLIAALFDPGDYAVTSDRNLATAVRRALYQKTGLAVNVRPVPELAALGVRSNVRPFDLLFGLGRTTSALPGLHSPGAAGLSGLAALRTASRWAIIRYLWAFHEYRPEIYLSELTEQVRFHQRTLLSEHFGIAVATDLVEQFILRRPAKVVDADAVTFDPVLAEAMRNLKAHKPDYFWYDTHAGGVSDVVVVEVKGNSSNRQTTVRQLARGVQQVLVPANVPGATMRRIVIGACLQGDALEAFAVEVPDPDTRTRRVALERMAEDEGPSPKILADINQTEDYLDTEVIHERLAVEVEDLDQARLLAFAGIPSTLAGIRESPAEIMEAVNRLEVIDTAGGAFRCETTRIPVGPRSLNLRTGVAEEFLDLSSRQAASARRERYRARYETGIYVPVPGRPRDRQDELLTVITSADGCMLSVSIV